MRVAYSLGSVLTIEQVLNCAAHLSKYNPDTIWIPETWGMESFSMLSSVSQYAKKPRIGSSIINIYSRSPAVVGMGAATVDTISNGRLILGLGTSSPPIVENFHGYLFQKPIERMREYIEIIRLVLSGQKITFNGKFFCLKDFRLLIKPVRKKIPIYIAAVNEKMLNLTWERGDGAILYLRPIKELKNLIPKMQSKRKIEVTCQIITAISNDAEKAIERAKKTLAFYVSVGKIYREFLGRNGFSSETKAIFDEYKKSGLKENFNLVSKSMLDSLVICGTPEEGQKKLKQFRDTGLDLPILQFNPVENVKDSLELLTSTFSGEKL